MLLWGRGSRSVKWAEPWLGRHLWLAEHIWSWGPEVCAAMRTGSDGRASHQSLGEVGVVLSSLYWRNELSKHVFKTISPPTAICTTSELKWIQFLCLFLWAVAYLLSFINIYFPLFLSPPPFTSTCTNTCTCSFLYTEHLEKTGHHNFIWTIHLHFAPTISYIPHQSHTHTRTHVHTPERLPRWQEGQSSPRVSSAFCLPESPITGHSYGGECSEITPNWMWKKSLKNQNDVKRMDTYCH